jgi:hypothetical protein
MNEQVEAQPADAQPNAMDRLMRLVLWVFVLVFPLGGSWMVAETVGAPYFVAVVLVPLSLATAALIVLALRRLFRRSVRVHDVWSAPVLFLSLPIWWVMAMSFMSSAR